MGGPAPPLAPGTACGHRLRAVAVSSFAGHGADGALRIRPRPAAQPLSEGRSPARGRHDPPFRGPSPPAGARFAAGPAGYTATTKALRSVVAWTVAVATSL